MSDVIENARKVLKWANKMKSEFSNVKNLINEIEDSKNKYNDSDFSLSELLESIDSITEEFNSCETSYKIAEKKINEEKLNLTNQMEILHIIFEQWKMECGISK